MSRPHPLRWAGDVVRRVGVAVRAAADVTSRIELILERRLMDPGPPQWGRQVLAMRAAELRTAATRRPSGDVAPSRRDAS